MASSYLMKSRDPGLEIQFARFREQFGKKYHVKSEFERRFTIFQKNLRKYDQHNETCDTVRCDPVH